MVEGGKYPRFSLESSQAFRVVGHLVEKQLDRHFAPELRITCSVDVPHASGTEDGTDLVLVQDSARSNRHEVIRILADSDFRAFPRGFRHGYPTRAKRSSNEIGTLPCGVTRSVYRPGSSVIGPKSEPSCRKTSLPSGASSVYVARRLARTISK